MPPFPIGSTAEALSGARLLWQLPGFLRRRVRLEQARETVRARLTQREPDFLAHLRRFVFAQPHSPYRRLLGLAGCEHGDLDRLLAREGLEGALVELARRGVYLTVDEFKGRRAVRRGSATFIVEPDQLLNPGLSGRLIAQSGGSRGSGTPVPFDLSFVRDRVINKHLELAARGGADWVHAAWGVPGGAAMALALDYSALGSPLARWFSQVDPEAGGVHPRYLWSARLIRWASLLTDVPIPAIRHVPIEAPEPIAEWLAEVLRMGRTPHLYTFASTAVRLCQAALTGGWDLSGAQLTLMGEPMTAARLAVLERAGVQGVPSYGITEVGPVGLGCLNTNLPGETHFYQDKAALIQAGKADRPDGLPPSALLISTLRSSAPMILLNVSMGDQAELFRRDCGCALQSVGWDLHLRDLRSFEKLTAGGMTFLDSDVTRVLDEVLPIRFGGGPTDYQLVEEERPDGRSSLRLLVHPSLGPLEPEQVLDTFLAGIGGGSSANQIMALQWRQDGLLTLDRQPPMATPAGKILHLHLARSPESAER